MSMLSGAHIVYGRAHMGVPVYIQHGLACMACPYGRLYTSHIWACYLGMYFGIHRFKAHANNITVKKITKFHAHQNNWSYSRVDLHEPVKRVHLFPTAFIITLFHTLIPTSLYKAWFELLTKVSSITILIQVEFTNLKDKVRTTLNTVEHI